MMTIHWILLGLGMACIGLSFFLSGLEAGLVEVSRLRLRRMAREGDLRASRLLGYLDHPEDTLWTILVGNTVANVMLGLVGLYGLQQLFGIRESSQLLEFSRTTALFWACFFVGCLLFYAFCELLSKTLFRKYATRLSVSLSRLFGWVELLFSPMVELLKSFSELMLFSADGIGRGALFSSREELRQLMTASGQGITDDERVMIDRVLDLQKIPVRELAVAFDGLPEISTETSISELISNQAIRAYTRLPVWDLQGNKRRIAGVLNLRRLIFLPESEWERPAGHFIESALYQDEDVRLQKLLQTMQRSGQRVVIILDKRKRELGMVSLQDILKVVFGEVKV